MTNIYGLRANGPMLCFDRIHSIYSKKLFKTAAAALDYKLEFVQLCTDCNNLIDLDPKSKNFHVNVVTYELET